MFKIFKVCDLEKMINLNLKLIKYIYNKKKIPICALHMLPKKLNA